MVGFNIQYVECLRMRTSSAIALIPADRARIVVPEDPGAIVIKHLDGELMRVPAPTLTDDPSEGPVWVVEARHSADVTWRIDSHGRTLHEAIVDLADMQGVGLRTNEETSNIVREAEQGYIPTTDLEIELLDYAALLVDDDRHLPVIIRTGESEYWRARFSPGALNDHPPDVKELVDEDIRGRDPTDSVYIIERADGTLPSDDWEPIDAIAGTDASPMYAVDRLAHHAEIPTSDAETQAIQDTFDELDMNFGYAGSMQAKELAMGVSQETVTFEDATEE